MIRTIRKIAVSVPVTEGAGVKLRRAFGFRQVPELDPFLLLDDFRGDDPDEYVRGFPWHPHRGIETVTYMLEGTVEHGDSLGNSGIIGPGDVQWMTAGSGIIHQEMPMGDKRGRMGGFQLWVNLPAASKMMDPRYRDIASGTIPKVALPNGGIAAVIAGEAAGAKGPVRDLVVRATYLDVTLPPAAAFEHPVPEGDNAFAYVIRGAGYFDEERNPLAWQIEKNKWWDVRPEALLAEHTLLIFGDGDGVRIEAGDEGVRFLLASGKPLGEPVAWYGPIVMNTRDELRLAFEEFERGDFIKHTP